MTSEERSTAIYKAVEEFAASLDEMGVVSSIIAVAIDETPNTGYGTSRVKGNSRVVLEQVATACLSLPTPEFFMLMSALATGPLFASNRGERADAVTIDPKLVN